MTDETLQELGIVAVIGDKRDAILSLAQQHGASNVRVFGSVARGSAHHGSDIDFVVSFGPGATIFDVAGLWRDLQDLLGVDVDLITDHDADVNQFKQSILAEAVPL